MLMHPDVKIGDMARFPLGRLGDETVYRRRWMAVAFTRGLVVAKRLHDGITRTVAVHWWAQYTLDYRRKGSLPTVDYTKLPPPTLNTDRSKPGFYVSAIDPRKTGRYTLLAGPFSYPGDAHRIETKVRFIADKKHPNTHHVPFGVCRVETGEKDGRWNAELGLR